MSGGKQILPGGSDYSFATAINDAGQVVGVSAGAMGNRAVRWQNGTLSDPGILPGANNYDHSSANEINNAGQVVGVLSSDNSAFLWKAGMGMVDLNTRIDPTDPLAPYFHALVASAINDLGQIVGRGTFYIDNREYVHAFLLTPVSQ